MRPDQLPRRLDDLRGLRVARWVRESQAKQGDKYGPGAQRAMQEMFLALVIRRSSVLKLPV